MQSIGDSTGNGGRSRRLAAFACLLITTGCGRSVPDSPTSKSSLALPVSIDATSRNVETFCGTCHPVPPPETFPASSWREEVVRGFKLCEESGKHLDLPSQEGVVKYYLERAPKALPALREFTTDSPPDYWKPVKVADDRSRDDPPAVANVRFVHLFDDRKLDVLICEMASGQIQVLRPYESPPRYSVIAKNLFHPAHAEVVDLDGDGFKDVLVADLGSYLPTDSKLGSVIWLRANKTGGFSTIPLAFDLGRVADVQAADFDGDGDKDLVVAVFGWHKQGEILYLENRSNPADPTHPVFAPRSIDSRHGTIHVPVADLNGDGRPDFVALLGQEHETVVAFLNEGGGQFTQRTIFKAPHPAFGSSGITLVDLDHDNDLDVLLTNGDVMDAPLLRPDQGVRWLENRGDYPFREHLLATLYGAHRAVAADLDGDGDVDIAACSFLPPSLFGKTRRESQLDAIVILEQVKTGSFLRRSLETIHCDHPTCDLGDFDGDGLSDLVVGRFLDHDPQDIAEAAAPDAPTGRILLWKNTGKPVKGVTAP